MDEGEKIIRDCVDKISKHEILFSDARDLASQIVNAHNIIIIGEGINYYVAREIGLKLEELTWIPAEAYETEEFNQRVLARIKDRKDRFYGDEIIIALSPHDETYSSMQNTIEQIKSSGKQIIELTSIDDEELKNRIEFGNNKFDYKLKIPTLPFYENAAIISLQHMIIEAANFRNIWSSKHTLDKRKGQLDQPFDLAKTVTTR